MTTKKILAGITAVAISTAAIGTASAAIPADEQAGRVATSSEAPQGIQTADAGGNWFLNLFSGIPARNANPSNPFGRDWANQGDRGSQDRDSIY
jgi:hypothetical protein